MATTLKSSLEVDGKVIFEGLGEVYSQNLRSTSVPYGGGWTKYTYVLSKPIPPGRYICFIQTSYSNLTTSGPVGCYVQVPGFGNFYIHKITTSASGVDQGTVWASTNATVSSIDFYWQQQTTSGGSVTANMVVQFMKIR